MLKIGYRTLKTAIGCGISIEMAQLLHLHFYTTAGIITVLSIKGTKRASLQSAFQRFISCLLGITLAAIVFKLFPHQPIIVAALLLLFIPLVVKMKAREGVVTSSVMVVQFFSVKHITWNFIGEEIAVIVIGLGVALLLNAYMPSLEKEIVKYRLQIEKNFSVILKEFASFLREGQSDWGGHEILETEALLKEAGFLALKDEENRILREKDNYDSYFKMRGQQLEILERLMPVLSTLDETYVEGKQIGDFLERLSQKVSPKNTADFFLEELHKMRKSFRESALPKDWREFENRSALLHFTNEMERYLLLKSRLGKSYLT
ncbi:MAG TPA: aromatic acid exporter family protein [Bacillales bacterium]|nr:aromatic acid exporter family protein [Bacillales bacterium]